MNRKKSLITIALIAVLAIAGLLVHKVAFAKETTTYRFGAVSKGDISATVSATGTLNAVTTVSVGTQVSGQVSQLLVNYNDHVKKGQLLARIDPTLFRNGRPIEILQYGQPAGTNATRDQVSSSWLHSER